jgi:AraC family transcriptional regulator
MSSSRIEPNTTLTTEPSPGPPIPPDVAERVAAVARAVGHMRAHLDERHSLRDLAKVAYLSPFYFHRVFRQVTEGTPARFLAALRMAEAMRLLVSSEATVTRISVDVGYSSLGTFTTQFTRLVGVTPGRLRRIAAGAGDREISSVLTEVGEALGCPDGRFGVRLLDRPGDLSPVMLGLFDSGMPQQVPAGCAIAVDPTRAGFGAVRAGEYHVLAVGFGAGLTVSGLLAGAGPCRCRVARGRLVVTAGDTAATVVLRLRTPAVTDPPLLCVRPLLGLAAVAPGLRSRAT